MSDPTEVVRDYAPGCIKPKGRYFDFIIPADWSGYCPYCTEQLAIERINDKITGYFCKNVNCSCNSYLTHKRFYRYHNKPTLLIEGHPGVNAIGEAQEKQMETEQEIGSIISTFASERGLLVKDIRVEEVDMPSVDEQERYKAEGAGMPKNIMKGTNEVAGTEQARNILFENKKNFRILFESTADPILLLHREVVINCNKAALRAFRCPIKKALVGLHPWDCSPERQPDGRFSSLKASEILETALSQGTSRFEWVHNTFDGQEFSADISLTAVPLRDGTIIHTVLSDISKRKRTKEALKKY